MQVSLIRTKNRKTYKQVMDKFDRLCARIGWFDNTQYEDKTPVAKVARTQEFGTLNKGGYIPPRPFMRPAKNGNLKNWNTIFRVSLQKGSLEEALMKAAIQAVGDIRQAIMNVWRPPLAKATVLARLNKYSKNNPAVQHAIKQVKGLEPMNKNFKTSGIMKPLIDTGLMISSLSYEIIDPREVADEHTVE